VRLSTPLLLTLAGTLEGTPSLRTRSAGLWPADHAESKVHARGGLGASVIAEPRWANANPLRLVSADIIDHLDIRYWQSVLTLAQC
jgi:hypothetical protein